MSSFSCKGNTKESLAQLKAKLLPYSTQETKPQYTLWRLKMDGCTATAYTSGTLLLQGTDIAWAMDLIDHDRIDYKDVVTFPRAGSDEAGCGEYYGPMTFGAVIVPTPAIAEQLTREGLRDTKKMTDKAVLRLDALVRQTCTFACVTVHPEQYNRLVKQGMSLVDMKCFFPR
jgi:ribonuclease HIII